MSTQISMNYMPSPAEHSDGALQTTYGMPSAHDLWSQHLSAWYRPNVPWEISCADGDHENRVRFRTTVTFTSPDPLQVSGSAWSRLACLWMLTNLRGRALDDACKALADLYVWQRDTMKVEQKIFFFSSRRRHTRSLRDWSSDVCSSD